MFYRLEESLVAIFAYTLPKIIGRLCILIIYLIMPKWFTFELKLYCSFPGLHLSSLKKNKNYTYFLIFAVLSRWFEAFTVLRVDCHALVDKIYDYRIPVFIHITKQKYPRVLPLIDLNLKLSTFFNLFLISFSSFISFSFSWNVPQVTIPARCSVPI